MDTFPERTKVFISYSHKDTKHLDRLHTHLAHYERIGVVDYWDDTKISPGAEWKEEIKKALQSTKVAILLVSADFLASKFISENELPPLLSAAKANGAIILPVILSPCVFEASSLFQFQAVNPPSKPLSKMSRHEKEETWLKIARVISNTRIPQEHLTNEKVSEVRADANKSMLAEANKEFSHFASPQEILVADSRVQVGQRLWNHYQVLAIVGRTNHSEVVKAWDDVLKRLFAIKLLYLDQAGLSDNHLKRFKDNLLQEASILGNLDHNNIAKVFSIMREPLAIVMQWVEGRSLDEILNESISFPVYDIVKIGMKLANALSYAHNKGVTHRDIKPSNIILNEQGEPILIDFDIASSNHQNTNAQYNEASSYIGSAEYSATEQFEHPENVGSAADMFALGVVLYQALTNSRQRPYPFGNNPKQYDGKLPQPKQHDIPLPLYQILCALLSQHPMKRPSASKLHDQLKAFLTTLERNDENKSSETFLTKGMGIRFEVERHITFCPFIDRWNEDHRRTIEYLIHNINVNNVGDYHILLNYHLPIKGTDLQEFDLILINKFGVFLLEMKGWIGQIDAYNDVWIIDGTYKRENALLSINRKARIFYSRVFGNEGELKDLHHTSVIGLVVLTQGINRFKNRSNDDTRAVVGLDTQLLRALGSTDLLRKGSSSRILSDQEIRQVREVLFERHYSKRAEIVDSYHIFRVLSYGDLFDAYEAQHINIPTRRVRVKRYQLQRLSQPAMDRDIRHFRRCAESVAALGFHPHILNTFDFFPDPQRPDVLYEITELARDRLDEVMARTTLTKRSLSLENQLDYLEPLCKALAFAHNHKGERGGYSPIYHRNISPETVFVTNDNIVKLGDFDFAKFGPHTITVGEQPLIEKPYTAPELLENASLASAASDIYALGVLWYFLGCLPSTNPKFEPTHSETKVDALQLPEAARTLMKRMVARVPTNRPQTIEEVLNELKKLRANK